MKRLIKKAVINYSDDIMNFIYDIEDKYSKDEMNDIYKMFDNGFSLKEVKEKLDSNDFGTEKEYVKEDDGKFNAKEMKFLDELLKYKWISRITVKYIGDHISDDMIKYIKILMNEEYGQHVIKPVAVIIANNILSKDKLENLINYICFRKSDIDEEDIFDFVNINKDVNFNELSKNNFIKIFNGGVLKHLYNSTKIPFTSDDKNKIIDLCNKYFSNLSEDDKNILVDMGYCYMKGADDEHIDYMYQFDKSTNKSKNIHRYIRDLISQNEDIDFLDIIKDNNVSENDIYNLLEYYSNGGDLQYIKKELKNNLSIEEIIDKLKYDIDEEDTNKYMNDYDNYINEEDINDDIENKDYYYNNKKVSNRIIKKLIKG